MRITRYPLIVFCIALCAELNAQTVKPLLLMGGSVVPTQISQRQVNEFHQKSMLVAGKRFAILQFESIPSPNEKAQMAGRGIQLLDYLPTNGYTAAISGIIKFDVFKKFRVRAILNITSGSRVAAIVEQKKSSEQRVVIKFFPGVPYDTIIRRLDAAGIGVLESGFKEIGLLTVSVTKTTLQKLSELPFVSFIEAEPPAPQKLLFESRNNSRANMLQSALPSGYHLTGKGIVVGIAEAASGAPTGHVDFFDRNSSRYAASIGGEGDYHATHVFGIFGGAGLMNEKYKGYAPEATIIGSSSSFFGSSNVSYAKLYNLVKDSGMVMTSNSYATGGLCINGNDANNYLFDRLSIDFPYLLNVYAGGNSGQTQCDGFPFGFGTLYTGGNSSKNTISVGNTTGDGTIAVSSSKGPGYGGRIKPDITAMGTNVVSTTPYNNYGYGTGTSMSTPAVAGGLALLNQRYRELHNGVIPEADIMKTLICNTATDLGLPGPDYTFGFGWMNLLRAVRALDKNWLIIDSVGTNSSKQFNLDVPTGVSQVKLMIYWQDPPNANFSSRSLVNDLDMTITGPDGIIHLPYILDTARANAMNGAFRGEDHINNVEQIVLQIPAQGRYTINVKGTEIGQGERQRFVISYDLLLPELELTFPNGGEGLPPNEPFNIQWEDGPLNESTYKLEYSVDNGMNWQILSMNTPATKRQFSWTPPATITNQAIVRVSRNADNGTSSSKQFTILPFPTASISAVQCPGYISMQWTTVTNATDYEVFILRNGKMESVAVTSNTNYKFTGLSPDTLYYLSVRARLNGSPGKRSLAVWHQPNTGNCNGDISDGDMQLSEIISPVSGRKHTSTALKVDEKVSVRLRNMDDQSITGFNVGYRINNGSWIIEQVNNVIPASSSFVYQFTNPVDLSATGDYQIEAYVDGAGDPNNANDTLRRSFRNLDNVVMNLETQFIDSFVGVPQKAYLISRTGLEGATRYDYLTESPKATMTYWAEAVFPATGRQGMRMQMKQPSSSADHHQFIGTYNLSTYDTALSDLGFTYLYTHTLADPGNLVLIRGSDTDPWLTAGIIPRNIPAALELFAPMINLTKVLKAGKQNYSSSFQVAFDQRGTRADAIISEIDVADITKDMALVSIDSTKAINYAMGNSIPVRVRYIYHGREPVSNVHIKYRLDDKPVVDEILTATINAGDTLTYIFNQKADFSAPGLHTLEAWVESPGDLFPHNDKKKVLIRNIPIVKEFPYLQNFESNDGDWFAEGTNNSWQYGKAQDGTVPPAASGDKVWKTGLASGYNKNEASVLYSPVFNLRDLNRPMVSMSIAVNFDNCYTSFCDVFSVAYSIDGTVWRPFVPVAVSYKWPAGWDMSNEYRWRVSTNILPDSPLVRLRFTLTTNSQINLEGISIDDIHIYDSIGAIYDGATIAVPINKSITGGSEWIEFRENDRLLASINPEGQNLGATEVNYERTIDAKAGNFHGQYYLGRRFAVKTNTKPADSVTVRLYIQDRDIDALLGMLDCESCTNTVDVYRLGVSTFIPDEGSTDLSNISLNSKGRWEFIPKEKIRYVPFGNGYYAQFKVKEFGAYWFNNGGLTGQEYLPVIVKDLQVARENLSEGKLGWSTGTEINIDHFDIELAKGEEAMEQGAFVKIGQVNAGGQSSSPQFYNFVTDLSQQTEVHYYRIKTVDQYGNYFYSASKPLTWSGDFSWQVYPNPSTDGLFHFRFHAAVNEQVLVKVFDVSGKLIFQQKAKGNGYLNDLPVDLGRGAGSGVYLLRVEMGGARAAVRLLKQ